MVVAVTSILLIKTQSEDNNIVVEANTVEVKENVVVIDDDTKKNDQPKKISLSDLPYKYITGIK